MNDQNLLEKYIRFLLGPYMKSAEAAIAIARFDWENSMQNTVIRIMGLLTKQNIEVPTSDEAGYAALILDCYLTASLNEDALNVSIQRGWTNFTLKQDRWMDELAEFAKNMEFVVSSSAATHRYIREAYDAAMSDEE